MQITPKTSVISWLPLCFILVPSPSRAIFYKHKSDHMMPSFNFCKGIPLHLNKTEASQHGPNLLCAIHPFVSAAAMLVFFRFLMCVTHRCHTLLPSPGALSPSSFHPAGLGMSLFPELLSRSHPLKFSFPSMVSFPHHVCFLMALTLKSIGTNVILYCWLPCQTGRILREEGTLSGSSAHYCVAI